MSSYLSRQFGQHRCHKQRPHIYVQSHLPQPRDHSHHQQRVSAQLKEVVVTTHSLHLQHIAQISATALSISPTGSSYSRAAYASVSGAGNAFRSTFPFGVNGSFAIRT